LVPGTKFASPAAAGPPRTAAVVYARVFAKQKLEGVKLHGCSFTPAQGIEAQQQTLMDFFVLRSWRAVNGVHW
jgi:hypothetical protein